MTPREHSASAVERNIERDSGDPLLRPAVSVVICTRDRLSKLKNCVDTLLLVNTTYDWELIVVDNGSRDGTSEYLASIDQKRVNRAHVITTFELKRGTGAAKNTGWHIAKAGIVAFTDDDCYVTPDYVDSLIRAFDGDSPIDFLTGRILLFDNLDFPVTIQESRQKRYFQPLEFIAAGALQGANMAFRRIVLERIGGFDERMGPGTPFVCEDIDAAAAAVWSGSLGVYDPDVVVYHHHGRRTQGEVQALIRVYDLGRRAYYAKYILAKATRPEYLRAWMRSIRNEFVCALRQRHLPVMQKSRREVFSGLSFALKHRAIGRRNTPSAFEHGNR